MRIADLVGDTDPTAIVAATPAWNVHDVIAHLSGLAEDAANDNMSGAPGEAWTAAQVERGRDRPIAQMLERWEGHATTLVAVLDSPEGVRSSATVVDVNAHEADLRHALGLPPEPDDEFVSWAAPMMRKFFARAVESAGLAPITVEASDWEVVRGRLGRRTAAEVTALDWSADPAPYLDTWFMFGPRDEPLGEGSP